MAAKLRTVAAPAPLYRRARTTGGVARSPCSPHAAHGTAHQVTATGCRPGSARLAAVPAQATLIPCVRYAG